MISGIAVNEKYRRMEIASNILGYIPWIISFLVFAVTGSLLMSLVLLTLFGFTVSVLAVILGHVARYKIRKSKDGSADWEPSTSGLVSGYFGFSVAVAFFLWFPYGDPLHGRSANEASAIGALRSIQRMAENYETAHPQLGFPETLSELASSPNVSETDTRIDPEVLRGQKSGYRFTYLPKRNKDGRIDSYEVFADPIKEGVTGTRHFFVDQDGVLRFAFKSQANAQSTAVVQ